VVLSDRFFFTSLARDSVRGMDPTWLRSLFNFVVSPDLVMYFKVPVGVAISRVLKRRQELRRLKRIKARNQRLKQQQQKPDQLALPSTAGDSDAEEGSDGEEEINNRGNNRNTNKSKIPGEEKRQGASQVAKQDYEDDEKEEEGEVELNFYEAGLDCELSDDPLENFHLFQRDVMLEYDHMVNEYGFQVIDATSTRDAMFSSVTACVTKALKDKPNLARCTEIDPLVLRGSGWYDDEVQLAARKQLLLGRSAAKHPIRMFFRTVLMPMRTRFSQLMPNLSSAPIVLLHGI